MRTLYAATASPLPAASAAYDAGHKRPCTFSCLSWAYYALWQGWESQH